MSLRLLLPAALGAVACTPSVVSTAPPPGAPVDPESYAIAEAPYEPGELPKIPGAPQRPQEAVTPAAADEASASTGLVLRGVKLGHDPQVAAGERVLVVYTSHTYQLLDKATGAPLEARAGDEIATNGDFGTLFSPLWAPRDRRGAPNAASVNLKMHFAASDPARCDPEAPRASRACVQEFYDTRIQYDFPRKRFWIESAVRNHMWQCGGARPCDRPELSPTQARRFIAVAVSRTEDPRDGFHRYVLVDEYADWPKIAVHDRYLLLSHRASPNLYVFDADRLAAGNPGRGPVRLAKIDVRAFGARFFDPVMHRGPSPGVTFLLGTDGTRSISLVGLVDTGGPSAAPPTVVRGPRVDVGERVGHVENDAIWRDGMLHATWDACARPGDPCVRQARVLRLPTTFSRATLGIGASNDPARGFRLLGVPGEDPGDDVATQKPAIDVTSAGAVVVVYARRSGDRPSGEILPEVRYTVLGRDDRAPRPSVLLRRGTTSAVPDIDENAKAGIDLAFAQVDPTDERTVWITHAYADADARWFRQIVAAVRP